MHVSSPKACFVPEPTECTEYSLTNDGGNAQEPYTYTDCATGFITEGSVALGQTVFICSETYTTYRNWSNSSYYRTLLNKQFKTLSNYI